MQKHNDSCVHRHRDTASPVLRLEIFGNLVGLAWGVKNVFTTGMARMHYSALPHAVTDADDGRPRSRAHWIWRLDLTRSAGLRRRTRGLRLVHTARLWIRPLAAPCSRERRKRGDDGAASTARDPDGVPRPSWAPRNMQRALYHREKFSPHTRAPPTKRKCLQRRTGDSMHGLHVTSR